MRKRTAQLKLEALREILQKILKKRNIPHTSTDPRLLEIWRRAVGPQIASQTSFPNRESGKSEQTG